MSEVAAKAQVEESVIWHDVECGGYSADLPVWERLAAACDAGIADLGCGTGRVALHLGRLGHQVTGIDLDGDFIAELDRRAKADRLTVEGWRCDVRALGTGPLFELVIAPMQLIQLIPSSDERVTTFRGIKDRLTGGGRAAFAVVEPSPVPDGDLLPLPDVREVDGWVFSSLPLSVETTDEAIEITRLRQIVSPAGEMTEGTNAVRLALLSADVVEQEAVAGGLHPLDRLEIPTTDDHLGSSVVVLEKP